MSLMRPWMASFLPPPPMTVALSLSISTRLAVPSWFMVTLSIFRPSSSAKN
jgi:hypothetical protein